MPNCKKCSKFFPFNMRIGGKMRNFKGRKFCLECSPFGTHNTKNICKSLKSGAGEKQCTRCELVLPLDGFYGSQSKVNSWCKRCYGIYVREKTREVKRRAVEYKGGKCCRCGYNRCLAALEFHHKDPTQKDPEIRFGSSRSSWEEIVKELDKCILLCSNCHREEHERIFNIREEEFIDRLLSLD